MTETTTPSGPHGEQAAAMKKAKCIRCNLSKFVDNRKWCRECSEVSDPETFENCVKCKSRVRNADNGLQCDTCLGWYHAGCDQVDVDDYKVFKKPRYVWCCRACSQGMRERLQGLKEMKKAFKEIQEENRALKALLESHEERLKKLENTREVVAKLKEEIKEELQEEEDKKRRKNNLILFRVKEKDTEEATARNDMATCGKVFSEVLEVRDAEVTEIKRLGTPARGKDRPLLVKLRDSITKFAILKQAKHLRHARDQEIAGISVTSDMTRKQREVVNELRNQLKEKRDQGDFTWYIDYKNSVLSKKREISQAQH